MARQKNSLGKIMEFDLLAECNKYRDRFGLKYESFSVLRYRSKDNLSWSLMAKNNPWMLWGSWGANGEVQDERGYNGWLHSSPAIQKEYLFGLDITDEQMRDMYYIALFSSNGSDFQANYKNVIDIRGNKYLIFHG